MCTPRLQSRKGGNGSTVSEEGVRKEEKIAQIYVCSKFVTFLDVSRPNRASHAQIKIYWSTFVVSETNVDKCSGHSSFSTSPP